MTSLMWLASRHVLGSRQQDWDGRGITSELLRCLRPDGPYARSSTPLAGSLRCGPLGDTLTPPILRELRMFASKHPSSSGGCAAEFCASIKKMSHGRVDYKRGSCS